jgi:hypothetical protein
MAMIPERDQQIRQAHATLIHQVVKACQNQEAAVELNSVLEVALQQGWNDLVNTIQLIVKGNRDASMLNALDEEDSVIIKSILDGLQNPASLPDIEQQGDATMAAAEQMTSAPGDMARIGGNIKRLVDGERDADILCKGMGPSGEQLMLNLIEELNKLAPQ